MKGTHVKSTGKGGWLEAYTWNKHNLANWDKVCNVSTGITQQVFYMYVYHDSNFNDEVDYIGLVSKDGFKNTGLKNGENHLKCWFKGAFDDEYIGAGYYNKEWVPDFKSGDG